MIGQATRTERNTLEKARAGHLEQIVCVRDPCLEASRKSNTCEMETGTCFSEAT